MRSGSPVTVEQGIDRCLGDNQIFSGLFEPIPEAARLSRNSVVLCLQRVSAF
ncbi:hypothetical protein HLB23_39315 [Nocardia uniformis]|uniref:Uncharacterized protein n=1 Tax=Nocardia uniformis TaxID=53432 RepID=A0A849CGM6_9NOCA|nr:hypothetical protein [Nocardia uniformis]